MFMATTTAASDPYSQFHILIKHTSSFCLYLVIIQTPDFFLNYKASIFIYPWIPSTYIMSF